MKLSPLSDSQPLIHKLKDAFISFEIKYD